MMTGPLNRGPRKSRMPCKASTWVDASWLVALTMLGLMTTYFLVLSTGRIWSSMAASDSQMFLRRLSPRARATTERRAVSIEEGTDVMGGGGAATGASWACSSLTDAVAAAAVHRKFRREKVCSILRPPKWERSKETVDREPERSNLQVAGAEFCGERFRVYSQSPNGATVNSPGRQPREPENRDERIFLRSPKGATERSVGQTHQPPLRGFRRVLWRVVAGSRG